MKSNFEFLKNYWPDLYRLGELAESYLYGDTNTCIVKIGMMGENIVHGIFVAEEISIPEDDRQVELINILRREDLLPRRIDQILYTIRKARNKAAHHGMDSFEEASALLRMTHSLCEWYMAVYGDYKYIPQDYVEPIAPIDKEDLLKRIEDQETRIAELAEYVYKSNDLLDETLEERKQRSVCASTEITLTRSELTMLEKDKIRFEMIYIGMVNYAIQQNKRPLLPKIIIYNDTENEINNVEVKITSNPIFFQETIRKIESIPPYQSMELKHINPIFDLEYMLSLSEKELCNMIVELSVEGELCYSETVEVWLLTYDQWQGTRYFPELLASFVLPNHPAISMITTRAADFLEKWTGDPSLDGYQTQNPERVRKMTAAIYSALQEQNIIYSEPPAGLNEIGQRVRLCDTIMQQKQGTCLDLTLFYASCLESIGINPIIILKKGHCFLGVWLENAMFPDTVQSDISAITKRLAEGISEIDVVECTAFVAGKTIGYNQASQIAQNQLVEIDEFEYIIDVARARKGNISPLPVRIFENDKWTVQREIIETSTISNIPVGGGKRIDIGEIAFDSGSLTKRQQWERKLLDLGMRNSLINLRLSRMIVPVLTSSIDKLEDVLADGKDFSFQPRPNEWHIPVKDICFDNMHDLGASEQLIEAEFKNNRLCSSLNETDLDKRLKALYRSAKSSLEESGANTLFMAISLLKWYESDRSIRARYAPIILLPVDIVRKFGSQGYVIRLRDEEPQLNISLFEKLKQDFKIIISGLDPIPQDEHGIDTRKIVTIVRKAVMRKSRWDVLESAYLGNFSFSQFVMWNDIRNRYDDFEKNKIVRSLITGKLEWECDPMQIGDKVSEDNVLMPVPADASQLYAIEAASEGKSFVLHGPPGTGKSQTITALIANALANGKTVLFIAEKMAALEVVQKRLKKIKLDPFCLELHSNKSNKKAVLEQLEAAMKVTKYTVAEEYERKALRIHNIRDELDQYQKELHKKQSCEMTLYEMISEFETYREAPDIKTKIFQTYEFDTPDILDEQTEIVEKMVRAASAVGHPCNNSLRFLKNKEYTQTMRFETDELTHNYKDSIKDLLKSDELFSDWIHVKKADNLDDINYHIELAKIFEECDELPKEWLAIEDFDMVAAELRDLAEHDMETNTLRQSITKKWEESYLHLDPETLVHEYEEASAKWFISKAMAINKLYKKLLPYQKGSITKESLNQELASLANYQNEKRYTDAKLEKLKTLLDFALEDNEPKDWNKILNLVDKTLDIGNKLDAISGNKNVRTKYYTSMNSAELYKQLIENEHLMEAAKRHFYGCFSIDEEQISGKNWFDRQLDLCDRLLDNYTGIRDWITWNAICDEAKRKGLNDVIEAYYDGMSHENILNAYKKAIFKALIIKSLTSSQVLNGFSGALFNEKIKQFKQLDEELMRLSQEEIYCLLAAKLPDFTREATTSTELGILQRAIRSRGRGISIRKLFEQIPTLLPRLCPCMLMSPLSAAQYLEPNREPFDMVVFDEASQLQTCKAIGAIARGKNAIIVGDPKQMPPTSFFKSNAVDEDNIETEDLESILDDCLALNMPQTHLLWHYRSRHESLIAFSNNQFYENKLLTFPSVNDREMKVKLIHVDGVFDRGKTRTNEIEADAVIEEVLRRFRDPEERKHSIGIVTFNVFQQNMIDDKLSEICVSEEGLEDWINNSEEPLFIKNLESVQGDERDVILFSIGYGPTETGGPYMNFGPLNREGGWRRLNVAVSRARREMKVFCSLYPEQIDLSKTSAEGVAALRNFLEYAGGSQLPLNESYLANSRQSYDGIVEAIENKLRKIGYSVDKSIGHSKYRIDIGVIDPNNPDLYILGILLDGNSYKEAKTTRDRELAQISVLNDLGWSIIRIWTMDWFENSEKEFAKIASALEDAAKKKNKGPEKEDDEQTKIPEKFHEESNNLYKSKFTEDKKSHSALKSNVKKTLKYETYYKVNLRDNSADYDTIMESYDSDLLESIIKQIIVQEAPISEDLLHRRVVQACGVSKVGSRIRNKLKYVYMRMQLKSTIQSNAIIYWQQSQDPSTYLKFRVNGDGDNKRDAKDIPVQEIANAICLILFDCGSVPAEEVTKEAARLFGFARMGATVSSCFDNGIRYAIKEKRVQYDSLGKCILTEREMKKQIKLSISGQAT